jgi:hypothetical protein
MEAFQIPEKIQSLVYKGKKAVALWLLGKLIKDIDSGIYADYYKDFVRYANMYRIRLLVDWGIYRDALAFTCLENELYPENPNAKAYSEYLKTRLINLPTNKSGTQPQNKKWKGIAGMRELCAMVKRHQCNKKLMSKTVKTSLK